MTPTAGNRGGSLAEPAAWRVFCWLFGFRVAIMQRHPFHPRAAATLQSQTWTPTDGEINFLWSFIQGSLMIPETWNWLQRSYGLCERHAWVHFGVEMSFRDEYLLGPTILYAELIEKARHAIETSRTKSEVELRAGKPCFFCSLAVRDASNGASPPERLERGRDMSNLREFARRLEQFWRCCVCPDCSGGTTALPCRRHLLAAIEANAPADLRLQKDALRRLSARLIRYQKSFLAGSSTANDEDRAALIAAIGWCSGWRPLLAQLS
jgi:hypothetical protein